MFHHSVKFQCYVSLPEDGKLSYAEFSAHAVDNAMRHELFNHFDTDKDGFLQKAEMVDNNFNAMDQNGTFPSISRTDKLRLTCVIKKKLSIYFIVFFFYYGLCVTGDNEVSRHDFDHYYTNVSYCQKPECVSYIYSITYRGSYRL